MNIVHLRYALEVDRTKSISKAAENLYMGQPNLSRAIRELEESFGITIFERSSRGIETTLEGKTFLRQAARILDQVDELEATFKNGKGHRVKLMFGAPRSVYISCAWIDFVQQCDMGKMDLIYEETSSMHAVQMTQCGVYNLAVIRYPTVYQEQIADLLAEKGLTGELLTEFYACVLLSEQSPAAGFETLSAEHLQGLIELHYPDGAVPYVPHAQYFREECIGTAAGYLSCFNRAPAYEMLSAMPNTFMLSEPVPQFIQKRYQLLCKKLIPQKKSWQDVLVQRKGYRLSSHEKQLIELIEALRERYIR